MDSLEDGGGGYPFIVLENIWYVTFFIWNRDDESGKNVDLTWFVFRYSYWGYTEPMTSVDAKTNFCFFGLGKCEDMMFLEGVVASCIMQVFRDAFSYFRCMCCVGNVYTFLCDDIPWFLLWERYHKALVVYVEFFLVISLRLICFFFSI